MSNDRKLIEEMIARWAREQTEKVFSRQREKGVPEVFTKLLNFTKKKEVERYCDSIQINGSDFSSFIMNCDLAGFEAFRKHLEIVPEELKPTEAERKAFMENGVGPFKTKEAKKFVSKLGATFDQRKQINGHLFVANDKWHLFWFSSDDAFSGPMRKKSHWVGGDHVHYTSYLWNHNKDELWGKLSSPPYTINGAHIRYIHDDDKE